MLPKFNPAYLSELDLINQFSSGLQMIEDIITSHLSQKLKMPNIAINLSPFLNTPLICLYNENEPNHMKIKEFLDICIERWIQEAKYQQEIFNIKDQIIDEFEKLCKQMKDGDLIEEVRKQKEQIIKSLFDETNFDKKFLAGNLCKNFMHEFDIKMIENINYYITYVVWMPFITPLPEGLAEFIKKILHQKISHAPSKANILSTSAVIKKFIEDHLRNIEIEIQSGMFSAIKRLIECRRLLKEKNVVAINQLATILKAAQMNKKACTLLINEAGKINTIISSQRKNIQTIFVVMEANLFIKARFPFTYEYLELKNLEDEDNFEKTEQILLKLPKCLKCANLQFKNNKQNAIKITNTDRKKNMYELSFTYEPRSEGTNKEIITLSSVFTHCKTFEHLHFNFSGTSITTEAINHLAASITKMNQMKSLNLDFCGGNNSANNNSMGLLGQAISEMPNLCHLELWFGLGMHEITDDGIVQLSQAIKKSVCMQQLILYFWSENNGVTDKGIEELSQSIGHLHSIQQLNLNFSGYVGNHRVSDKGMQALATALKNTNNISDLSLNFYCGNNSITDASMDLLADALKQMPTELSIYLNFQSKNSPSVSARGESIIRNARTYRSIDFSYTKKNQGED